LTLNEPILLPAEVKNSDVIVQRNEVATAAISPTILGSKPIYHVAPRHR